MQPLRGEDVRQLNERIVLNHFYEQPLISQSEVVEKTGLKASTVLRIFSNLEKAGEILLVENGSSAAARAQVGRRPTYYRLNPSAHYALGLTFAKNTVELVIVDFALNIVFSAKDSFRIPESPELLTERLAAFVRTQLEITSIQAERILGIGVGCPGNVNADLGILYCVPSNPKIVNYAFAEDLERRLGYPVFLESSNMLAAQYYHRYEEGDFSHCLYISIGSEVTASYYEVSSTGMLAGIPSLSIGWILLDRPDAIFRMQRSRTLNDLCSEQSVLALAEQVAGVKTMQELNDALAAGNPELKQLAKDIAGGLTYWISNLAMLVRPSAIIIASRSKEFSRHLVQHANAMLEEYYYWPFDNEPKLLGKKHNFQKISRSAVDLVFDHEFNAKLGWKRPGILDEPVTRQSWNSHISPDP